MKRLELDLDHLVQLYRDGQSIAKIARELGVGPWVIRDRLIERGVERRRPWDYAPHVEQAHAAIRGRTQPLERRIAQAQSRQASGRFLGSRTEEAFAALLNEMGVRYVRQFADGLYNLDFALTEPRVAVELFFNRNQGSSLPRTAHRLEYLRGRGWHVIEVFDVGQRLAHLRGAAEYVVAFANETGRDPSAPRQHRMIRADGQPRGCKRRYRDSGTAVVSADSTA